MRRREFIGVLGGAAAWPVVCRAQQQPQVPIIARLNVQSPEDAVLIDAAFSRGIAEMGFVDGKNVTIERRWASGRYDRLPALAEELVRLNPALIVTGGNVLALAAKRATSTIPILFNVASDPVKLGLVNSFAHPGGNATGIATLTAALTTKRLELIRELVSPSSAVGFLVNPDNQDVLPEIEDAARAIGHSVQVVSARDPDDLERAFAQFADARVGALVISNDAFFLNQRVHLIGLANRHSLPAIYEWREFPAVGGLMSYGPSLPGTFQQLGVYASRILNGAKPSDLPVQQPTKFEFVINLKTAKALGLEIPPQLLARADEVIE